MRQLTFLVLSFLLSIGFGIFRVGNPVQLYEQCLGSRGRFSGIAVDVKFRDSGLAHNDVCAESGPCD